jgi:RNA polymerase sigma-70 factor (ECF subfamily)
VTDREVSAEVIEACRRGDRDAFRLLYETYKDRVYSACFYFFHGDAAEAADVTQEVFVKLFSVIAGFREGAAFSTWLYRMVHNACIDSARRKKIRERVPEIQRGSVASHETELLHSRDAATIQQAVSSLPPKYRVAVLLRHFEDCSYEDMSKVLKCSMGTVASRLNRAHKLLADALAPLRDRVTAGGRDA